MDSFKIQHTFTTYQQSQFKVLKIKGRGAPCSSIPDISTCRNFAMSRSGYHRDTWQPSGTTGRTQRHQVHHLRHGNQWRIEGHDLLFKKVGSMLKLIPLNPFRNISIVGVWSSFGRWWGIGICGDSWVSWLPSGCHDCNKLFLFGHGLHMHHWKQSVDGRLVPDVIYIAWLHPLCFSFQIHPWKINMEPNNGGFVEDDVPFETGDFQVPSC